MSHGGKFFTVRYGKVKKRILKRLERTGVSPVRRKASGAGIAALLLIAAATTGARAESGPVIIPAPQKATWSGTTPLKDKTFSVTAEAGVPAATVAEYNTKLLKWGYKKGEGGISISLKQLPVSECARVAPPAPRISSTIERTELQTYFLTSSGNGAVSISACGGDGFFYGLVTLDRMVEPAKTGYQLYTGDVVDYPVFPVRGVFEGAYGAWSDSGRVDVIEWMGRAKMNSYLYGPKGDPRVRRRWREPYSDVELFKLRRMVQASRENHILVAYTISPGQGVEYGSDADFNTVMLRIRQMQSIGFKMFVLGFDDTLGMVYNENDRKKFANLGEAEAFLSNRVAAALKEYDPDAVLVVVPEIYGGVHDIPYAKSFAEKLDKDIMIGWTGEQILSPKLTEADIVEFASYYKRPPSFGDNWGSIFPILGRDPATSKHMTQMMVNPYNLQGELPIPGLANDPAPELMAVEGASHAEFGWNPYAYDAGKLLDRLAVSMFDKEGRDMFRLVMAKDYFAFNSYANITTDYKPPILAQIEKAMADKETKAINAYIETTLPLISRAASGMAGADIIKTGHSSPVARTLAKWTDASTTYFKSLKASLEAARDAAKKNNPKLRDEALAKYITTLKGGK